MLWTFFLAAGGVSPSGTVRSAPHVPINGSHYAPGFVDNHANHRRADADAFIPPTDRTTK